MITFGLNGAAASASAVRIYCRSADGHISFGR
jgi:hypothetical protein